MTAFIIFGADDEVLKVSDPLLKALGYGERDSGAPLRWEDVFVEDAESVLPNGRETASKRGFLKRKSGEIEEARLRVEYIDPERTLRLVSVELMKPAVLDAAGALDANLDAASLNFLTAVSDELRVSLNGAIGFANLLGESSLNEEQKDILGRLQSCNYLLKGLINDILEYSRVVSANIDLSAEVVALDRFVEEVVGLFRERARRKGLDLLIDLDGSARKEVEIPKLRVTQVMSNLISNAVKFTASGWVRVAAKIEGARIDVVVQDTGPGVSEADEAKLFRPFAQTQLQRSACEGAGLGLATSKRLVLRMGGDLFLERPVEGGSAFRFCLPLQPAAQDRKARRPVAATKAPASRMKEKGAFAGQEGRPPRHVLIVEDNQLNADILSHFLRDYGASYDVVSNGRAAVDAYEDGKYDLVLMDVMLPEMNGYEATERIIATSGLEKRVPIIGVTAKVFRRDQMRCLESGMVEVVHKPVDFKALRVVLDRHLYGIEASSEAGEAERNRQLGSAMSSSLRTSVLEEYLQRMAGEGRDRRAVVDTALGIVDGEMDKLLDALRSENRDDVAQRAHSLKGALAILGAQNAWDLAKGLELVASKKTAPLRTHHWSVLMQEAYEDFKTALEDYLKSSRRSG